MAVVQKDIVPPINGKVTLKQSGQNDVIISMSGFSDDVGLSHYIIYLGKTKIGTTTGTSFTYKGSNLKGNLTFNVKAVDTSGNAAKTISTDIAIKDVTAPVNGKVTLKQSGQKNVVVSMSGFSDNVGISHYIVYLGKTRIGTTTGTSFTYKSSSDLDGNLTFNVKAVDAAGNTAKTLSTDIAIKDVTAPVNGKVTLKQSGLTKVTVSMSGFSDNVGVSSYIVYLGKTKIGTTTGTSFTYKSSSNLDGNLTFNVKAVDAAGNAAKTLSTVIAIDSTAPTAGSVALKQSGQNNVVVSMSGFSDNVGVSSYIVYLGKTKIGTTTGTSFTYKGSDLKGTLTFNVKAVDAAGLTSKTVSKNIAIKDVTAPVNGKVTLTQSGQKNVVVTMSGFSDNVGVSSYIVYLGKTKIGTTTGTSFTYQSTSNLDGNLTFNVKAVDAAGNTAKTISTDIAIKDVTAPVNGKVTLTQSGQNNVVVSMSGFSDNVGVSHYIVYLGKTKIGTTTGTSFTYKGSDLKGTLTFNVKAVDAAGNTAKTISTDIAIKDVTAPVNGKVTLTQSGQKNVVVTMSGFSDNVGVSSYIVYLGKTKIGTTTGTSFTYQSASNLDGELTFNVKAVDAAGNAGKTVSAVITAASATPLNKTISGIDNLTFEEIWNDEFENCQYGDNEAAHYKNCVPAAAKFGNIKGTAAADTITFAANKSRLIGSISLGDGNDKIVHLDSAANNEDDSNIDGYPEGSVYFNFGNGDDTLALGKYNTLDIGTIDMGSGTDILTMGTKSDLRCRELSFDDGNDTLSIAGGEYEGENIDFGAGSDKFSVHAASEVEIDYLIDFGDGNDTLGIAAGGVVNAYALNFGAGTDTLKLNGTLNIGLSSGLPCIKDLENLSGTGTLGINAQGSIDKSGIMNFVKGTDINVVNTLGLEGFRGYTDELGDNKISGSSVLTLSNTTDEAGFWLCGKNYAADVDFGLADAVDYIKLDKTSAISELEIQASGNYGSDWTFAVLDASGNTLSGSKYALMTDDGFEYTADLSAWSNGTYYLKFQVAANSALNGWVELDNI